MKIDLTTLHQEIDEEIADACIYLCNTKDIQPYNRMANQMLNKFLSTNRLFVMLVFLSQILNRPDWTPDFTSDQLKLKFYIVIRPDMTANYHSLFANDSKLPLFETEELAERAVKIVNLILDKEYGVD